MLEKDITYLCSCRPQHNSDHLQNPCAAQVWTVPLARYASPFGMGHVLRKHMNEPTMSLMDMPQRRRWYVRPRRFLSRRTCWTMKVEAQRERKPVHLGAMAIALATGEKPDMVAVFMLRSICAFQKATRIPEDIPDIPERQPKVDRD